MSILYVIGAGLLAGIVFVRCICVSAKINKEGWGGHPLQFLGIAAAYSLLLGGSAGMALWCIAGYMGHPVSPILSDRSPWLLLLGVALRIIFDRRRRPC